MFCCLAGGGKQVHITLLLHLSDFGGRLPDVVHEAPRSREVNSETTHLGQAKVSFRRLLDMNVNHWIKRDLIIW